MNALVTSSLQPTLSKEIANNITYISYSYRGLEKLKYKIAPIAGEDSG